VPAIKEKAKSLGTRFVLQRFLHEMEQAVSRHGIFFAKETFLCEQRRQK
jgi:hypothetical protein